MWNNRPYTFGSARFALPDMSPDMFARVPAKSLATQVYTSLYAAVTASCRGVHRGARIFFSRVHLSAARSACAGLSMVVQQ